MSTPTLTKDPAVALATENYSALAKALTATARQQVGEMRHLAPDWDGQDALPPDPRTLQIAEALLLAIGQETLDRQSGWMNPDAFPTPAGAVYLHWDAPFLKFSLIITPQSDTLTLLVGTGVGRSKRTVLSYQAAPSAVADLIEQACQTPLAGIAKAA